MSWLHLSNPSEVVPIGDLHDHVVGERCWCQPEVDDEAVLIHNSFDRREEFEQGLRKPS